MIKEAIVLAAGKGTRRAEKFCPDKMKTLARKFLGSFLSCAPRLGLIPKPSRENGISVIVGTRNEEEWIEAALLSIKDFADEIIVVDASKDKTPRIVEKLARKYKHISLIHRETDRMWSSAKEHSDDLNFALRKTRFKFIVKWDADMIARTSGKASILELRRKILSLNESKYYMISLPIVNLAGDLLHQPRSYKVNKEPRIVTFSQGLRWIDKGRWEVLKVPFFYKVLSLNRFYAFHPYRVKSARELLFKHFWCDWRETRDFDKFPDLEHYVRYRIERDWGITSLKDATKYYTIKFCQSLVPYDRKKFGDYPELLRERLKVPKYEVIVKNGRIIGRNDVL